jgi:hypothetical protein
VLIDRAGSGFGEGVRRGLMYIEYGFGNLPVELGAIETIVPRDGTRDRIEGDLLGSR